jgi:PhnB protein
MAKRSLPNQQKPSQQKIEQLDQAISALLAQKAGRAAEDARADSRDAEIAPLLKIAADLCDLPREEFKTQLKADLSEGRNTMATMPKPKAAAHLPQDYQTATPYLTVQDAAGAIEFYKRAFGATEIMRLTGPGEKIGHAEITIGNSRIMLSDEFPDYGALSPQSLGGSPVRMHLSVEDVDALAEQAVAAGAKIVRPVEDQFYGDRSGQLADPYGHVWTVSTHQEDVSPEEMQRRIELQAQPESTQAAPKVPREHLVAAGASARVAATPRLTYNDPAKAIDFYTKAFGAKETFRFEVEGKIPHAEIAIGSSVISLAGEWPEGGRFSAETLGQSPVQLTLQVANVDVFAARAVAAGLKPLGPIKDQFYGRREGSFVDPFGYTWNISTVTEEMPVEEMHRRLARMGPPPSEKTSSVPRGFHTLTAYLVAQDADALVNFVKKTFGAEETFRSGPGSEGGMHCEVQLEDSKLMIGGGGPGFAWNGQPKLGAFHVYVRDCDAAYQRALEAGATSIAAPQDQPYGERSGSVKDAAGNHWYIATYKGENYKWEGAPTVQPYLHPLRAEPVINFLKRAFGAEELGRYAAPDGVIHHTTLKIGDSYMEMGEAQGPYQPMLSMFYLYVADCDALYRRALTAGATALHEPKDQPYGDRSGAVTDPFGNQWYIATHVKDANV